MPVALIPGTLTCRICEHWLTDDYPVPVISTPMLAFAHAAAHGVLEHSGQINVTFETIAFYSELEGSFLQ